MNKLNLQTRDPKDLKKLHPLLRGIPALAEDSEEFLALCAGLKQAGFIQPILIDDEGNIIDDHSRHLAIAARRWQMTEVPVQVIGGKNAAAALLHSICNVRHLSKGAQIYLCVDAAKALIKQSEDALIEWHRLQRQRPEGAESSKPNVLTLANVCDMYKWSERMFDRAIEVKKIFADTAKYWWNVKGGAEDGAQKHCTAREWFEPRLLQAFIGGEHEDNRPIGLGGIIAGYNTRQKHPNSDDFNPKKSEPQLNFFASLFTKETKRFLRLSGEKQQAAIKLVEQAAAELPPEECEQLAATYKTMAKIYADAAKSNA